MDSLPTYTGSVIPTILHQSAAKNIQTCESEVLAGWKLPDFYLYLFWVLKIKISNFYIDMDGNCNRYHFGIIYISDN